MEKILPHGDEKIDLLRLDDITMINPKTLAELSVGFLLRRISNRTDGVQTIAWKFLSLYFNDDWDLVDFRFYLEFCSSNSRDCQ